jgi:hypothetical protein
MVITDKFIYVHLEKCGGTSIREFMRNLFPSSKIVSTQFKHIAVRGLYESKWLDSSTIVKPEYYTLPLIGTTRNPWSWYVSLYFDDKRNNGKYWRALSEGKNIDCRNFIKKLLDPPPRIRKIKFLPNQSSPPHKAAVMDISLSNGIGVYSYYHVFAFCKKGKDFLAEGKARGAAYDVKLLHLENFVGEFQNFAASIGLNCRKINLPKKNNTDHRNYRTYYDAETRKLVEELDSEHIKRYNYQF